ncbi:PorP/SprF family type IX secretion system membrane protein [Parasediminibacterium sp. JCM 36343]|uniref:PorP/SprF family type IX secretion system membrane protein n=1 Tax=Parasediminibacterium sp. JCM 36343 TaxID=3374279 RepID=UPI0039788D4E
MKKILLIVLMGTAVTAKAQIDPHFSQYYMHPLWLNPALTGSINGDYRVGVINRNQWSGITNAFSTIGVSADMVTNKNINFGVNLLQESAGDAGYKYFNGGGSISYSGIRFGRDGLKVISFALQGGIINRRFDFAKLRGGGQYKASLGFNPDANPENLPTKSASVFDMSTGVAYYDADPDKQVNFFGGFSAAHITQPKDNFFPSSADSKIPVRYALHGGARIILSDRASVVPNAVFMKQDGSTELMLGGYVQYSAIEEVDVMLGANYRLKDAFYPYLGLNFNNLIVGFSYDINASNLGTGAQKASSYEFSLMYSNKKGTDKGYFKCPRF